MKNLSDVYFVLEQLPESVTIKDFRHHRYQNLKSLEAPKFASLPSLNAREYLRSLADVRPDLLTCRSRSQLVDVLRGVANVAEHMADSGATNRSEMNLYCAVRDNTYQLIELLDPKFKK